MTVLAQVRMWGTLIGAVTQETADDVAAFEYSPAFSGSGIEVSPLTMPLANQVYRFPTLRRETFHGLPGLLADSLPDRFGNALIDVWLAEQGRDPNTFSAVERLCYTGARGMGALEFAPATGPAERTSKKLEVDILVQLASAILQQRADFKTSLSSGDENLALKEILHVGTSAGGARAKAVIAWNRKSNEIRSGQVPCPDGFEHWLIKFDGVDANKDKELTDPAGFGLIEYGYYKMALQAGIEMSPCEILEEGGRSHFMTRRFDRTAQGAKIHMLSLGAIAHYDFNSAGVHSYEQAFAVVRKLGMGAAQVEQLFRRMVFNIMARNQDDHVKNIAFLMDRNGKWRLAPAFDVTYAYQPKGLWTGTHQMSLNGKRDNFTFDDFKAAERSAGVKRGTAKRLVQEVRGALESWKKIARNVGVARKIVGLIAKAHRVDVG